MGEFIFLAIVIFLAGLSNSTFGFAMVSMSLLTLHFPLSFIAPLIPLIFISTNIFIVLRCWREIEWKSIALLLLGSSIAVPIGVSLSNKESEVLVKTVIGIFLIGFGLFNLLTTTLPHFKTQKTAPIFGFISGLFGGAFNVSGPPIVIYGLFRNWDPQKFRASLQGYFTYTNLLIISLHVYNGNMQNPKLLHYYLIALPIVLIATPIGKRINQSFKNPKKFQQVIYYLMLIFGTMMILKAYKFI